jgi:2-polyprenyl-3-methyl-5-hydroxy-6-metoxy-1,4-benzoquinol methylase
MGTVTRDPGSFRDPAGYVLHYGGAVYRSLDREAFDRLGTFLADPVYRRLSANGDLLPVAVADAGEREELARLERRDDRWYVRQRRLPFISYPYEWSPRMLHAAALCTLRIEAALIDRGFTLKDASAYNIQFDLTDRGPAPVFIDITSIEAAPPRPLWMAHHQFLRHFALPLILYRQFGYDYRGDFLADLEGVHPDSVYRIAGRLRRWLPPYLFLVTVPHLLRNLESDGTAEIDRRAAVPAHHHAERDRYILSRLVRRLERLIKRLEPPARASQWTGYEADSSYPPPAAARKEEFVARACATLKPGRLINLGCNLGKFDLIAADHGIEVIALDLDLASIDTVYQRARERHARIIPLRIDLAAPSPAIGWKNRERRSFLERACRFDCVMALAVVHHLLITNRIPLDEIVDLIARLSARHVVLELVDRTDSMFQRLARGNQDLYADLTIEAQERAFAARFRIVERCDLEDIPRTLYVMEKQ